MKQRLEIINWLTAADVVLCIISHRVVLAQNEKGSVSASAADIFQISLIGFFLLFLLVFAGLAVYGWKKVNIEPGGLEKAPEFPKTSFVIAIISIALFTIYWLI